MNEKMIQVTQGDMERLTALLASRLKLWTRDQEHLEMLARELDRAEIVRSKDIPADTVTMDSHVLVRDLDTGGEFTCILVFPSEADIAKGKISILAPIATALLGYREGDEIESPAPGGRRRLNVVRVLYQPEAARDESGHSVAMWRDLQMQRGKVEQSQLQVV